MRAPFPPVNEPATHVVSHIYWSTAKDNTEFSMLKHFPGIGVVSLGDSVVYVVGKDTFSPLEKDDDLCVVCVFVLSCLIV